MRTSRMQARTASSTVTPVGKEAGLKNSADADSGKRRICCQATAQITRRAKAMKKSVLFFMGPPVSGGIPGLEGRDAGLPCRVPFFARGAPGAKDQSSDLRPASTSSTRAEPAAMTSPNSLGGR